MNQELQSQQSRLIAKAWKDEAFKQQLKSNPKAAIQQEGITIPAETSVMVLEEEVNSSMVILPQKQIEQSQLERVKSQFGESEPFIIIQLLAQAQQDAAFKQKLLDSPNETISSALGKDIDRVINIAIVEEQLNTEYVFLPAKPEGDLELSEKDLEQVAAGTITAAATAIAASWVRDDW